MRLERSQNTTMRLAHRTTLIIGACTAMVVGGAGFLQWRNEEHDLCRVAESEARLLGRSLQVAFENALRDRQIDDVAETLSALERVDSTVAVYVYDGTGALAGASAAALPSPVIAALAQDVRQSAHTIVTFSPPQHPKVLRVAMLMNNEPLAGSAAVVLEKPLTEMQRDLTLTRRYTLTTLAALLCTVAALAWTISRTYVGRPLSRLIADMRSVRRGTLPVSEGPGRSDELGEVHREFELLVGDLRTAQVRASREAEARQRMERGLQQADKLITLGQLSAVLAHEIGSPLQILEGRARALAKHAAHPEATRRTADMLIEQTERITRIVAQMLCMTRRRRPVRAVIDADACVRKVVALLDIEARRRNLRIHVETNGPCEVCADTDQLQQVVLNLIRNALDASPSGGAVRVCLGGDAARFVLEIIDEGSGIPDSIRPHFFEPFFTTKIDSGGHGLGLCVVQAIVQEHHGKVIFPPMAVGCVARVCLPRDVEAYAA